MGRHAEAILGDDIAYAQGRQNKILDLSIGGQMGYTPQINLYTSDQPYTTRNLIAILVEAPLGFSDLPNPEYWINTLRALVELKALAIEGLDQTLEVTVEDTAPIGGGGEYHQDFTDVKQARSAPVFRWPEFYGRATETFLRGWVTNLMMDPNSKVANVATFSDASRRPDVALADYYSMTVAFFEPDPYHKFVSKSWLCTNMFPINRIGQVEGRRDLTQANQGVTFDQAFSSIAQTGAGVDYYCQQLLDSINLVGANPQWRKAFTQYDTRTGGLGEGVLVEPRLEGSNVGYKAEVDEVATHNIRPAA